MASSFSMHTNICLALAAGLALSGCAPAAQSEGKPLQTMECAGEISIEFYEQREFDKQCIEYIERKRATSPAS
jgi:hypothetical protein